MDYSTAYCLSGEPLLIPLLSTSDPQASLLNDGSQDQEPESFPPRQHSWVSFAISFSGRKQKASNVEFSTQTKNTGTETLLEIISGKRDLIKFDADSKL